ncbi:armadillo/beta-catenin-like repeat-containing protein [Polychaeton citri CBS 116435]|uniref:Armadillo/beta-catenin-like repeat-containing protein n=1 Tax=Polychaeton citri CBS 116435 TaxID=1314669 RepID=A0A9P4Q947_9PEZI|nr:armadillo/beta-catenin-like repeat-containing protein [Polychaeton citri CBS 116435]
MNDPGLNSLLQWGIENSDSSRNNATTAPSDQQRDPVRSLNADALAQLLHNAPSDADSMLHAMAAIVAPLDQVDLDNKLIAWDNFEMLIENIDNANNMESLKLWTPLLGQLDSEIAESRRWSAACLSTAVQNNPRSQERLLAMGGVSKLAALALKEAEDKLVKKKAINALSSEVRNYQPALTELEKELPDNLASDGRKTDAGDMEAVDSIIQRLRDHAA